MSVCPSSKVRKIYTRLLEFLLRLLILFQQLCGKKYPASPWVYWVRIHKAGIERCDGINALPDQLKFFVIGLMLEDSLWRQVSPPNSHQYRALVAEIDAPGDPDPISIIISALKIHYGILHAPRDPAIHRLETKLRQGLARIWARPQDGHAEA